MPPVEGCLHPVVVGNVIGNFKIDLIARNAKACDSTKSPLTPYSSMFCKIKSLGIFSLRYVMYRCDRVKKPKTILPTHIIKKNHICCDDPNHNKYNKIFETKNFNLGERLWRKD